MSSIKPTVSILLDIVQTSPGNMKETQHGEETVEMRDDEEESDIKDQRNSSSVNVTEDTTVQSELRGTQRKFEQFQAINGHLKAQAYRSRCCGFTRHIRQHPQHLTPVARKEVTSEDECSICCEKFNENEFGNLQWCSRQCGQSFHKDCFSSWAQSQVDEIIEDSMFDNFKWDKSITCPFCRANWVPGITQHQEYFGNMMSKKWARVDHALSNSASPEIHSSLYEILSSPQPPICPCIDCKSRAMEIFTASVGMFDSARYFAGFGEEEWEYREKNEGEDEREDEGGDTIRLMSWILRDFVMVGV